MRQKGTVEYDSFRLLRSQKIHEIVKMIRFLLLFPKKKSNDRSVQRIKGERIQLSRCQLQRV